MHTRRLVVTAVLAAMSSSARGDQAMIPASKDNTLYGYESGLVSNGAGQHFFAGLTGVIDPTTIRRGLIAFDVAGNVPAGATIDSVTLTLSMSRTHHASGPQPVNLHRVLADWGEGTSDAANNEGNGTDATTGDATWVYSFFDTVFWSTPGGDFSPTTSAGLTVDQVGFYTWGPTPRMRDDVQSWLDQPATNFGWMLRGNEGVIASAKRFDSRENPISADRPVLVVQYTPLPSPGDFDGDGDVDADDYPKFQLCISGPGGGLFEDCGPGDTDSDNDVDLADIAFFQAALSTGA